jgi:hypothetical protein
MRLYSSPRGQRLFHDRNGQFVVMQRPNALLWIWIGCAIVTRLLHERPVSQFTGTVGSICLVMWAMLEVLQGVNLFRRLLGVVVLGAAIAPYI